MRQLNILKDASLGCWLCDCDSVRCRKSTLQSLLKSRLQAKPLSFLQLFASSRPQSCGVERHASFPVVIPWLPAASVRALRAILAGRGNIVMRRYSNSIRSLGTSARNAVDLILLRRKRGDEA